MALAELLNLNLTAETAAPNPSNTKPSDPFANMPEPKLQQPGALAGLLQKLDPDLMRDDWRKTISCIHLHLGEAGYTVARNWCAEGDKFMLTLAQPHRKITNPEIAEKQFRKVWDEIAADAGFRMGAGALFDILRKQRTDTDGKRGMSPADIAQWHKDTANQADPETKMTPPPGFTLTSYFSNHTLTNKDAEKMEHTKFIYPNLIPQGLITAYPSPPNGGKTAIFTHAACKLADQGLEVFYINADASPSARRAAKVSEMYLTKIRPRTRCLYSAASMLARSLSAVAQRVFLMSSSMCVVPNDPIAAHYASVT